MKIIAVNTEYVNRNTTHSVSKLRRDYVTGFTFIPVALFLSCRRLRLYVTTVGIYFFPRTRFTHQATE